MSLQSKFGYCIIIQTLNILQFVCKQDGFMDKQSDRQMDRQTNDLTTRCPWRTFQAGGIKFIKMN